LPVVRLSVGLGKEGRKNNDERGAKRGAYADGAVDTGGRGCILLLFNAGVSKE
jgi:hypothetical protein